MPLREPICLERYDQKERQPIPSAALLVLQQNCKEKDDEARWLIALISDTGVRLAEAAGLAMNDVCLDEETTSHFYPNALLAEVKNKKQ